MKKQTATVAALALVLAANAAAEEYDYYKYLRYPKKLAPGVGVDKIEQDGGPDAVGYKRRTVQWWPRQGQDIVDIPEGAPLREWTRNKGQNDPEARAGVCRNWTASDPEKFKAHLIALRSFGTSTTLAGQTQPHIPSAVLRMENGEQRAVVDYGVVSRMLSPEDHDFIHKVWEEAYPKLYAKVSQGDLPMNGNPPGGSYADFDFKRWEEPSPKFNAMERPKDSKYPRWARNGFNLSFETPHFHLIARPQIWGGPWGQPANWVAPDDPNRQNLYRKHVMEWVENMWTYVEATGASMPYWRRFGDNYKYVVHIHGNRAAGGWGHCGVGDCSPVTLGHEFFHGQPPGVWDGHFIETMCNAGQHTMFPGELQMFDGNFKYPWRNVNYKEYGASLWCFVLGDNPNWGYGIQAMIGSLAGADEWTIYHTVAMLGQKRGLWKNGVKGFGDFFGEYAARMVTCDFVEQYMVRAKYGMPELSAVYPVYDRENTAGSDRSGGLRRATYRISNAEAPRWCGFNIIRLKPDENVKEIAIDFHGIYEPELYSDWRACIVAVDGDGRARYSPLWNKGRMTFALKTSDKHLWLTVSASPSAFPVLPKQERPRSWYDVFMMGPNAPRYPWEVTLTACGPGLPHRRQGDVVNLDELYGRCDHVNTYLNYPIKREVPITLDEEDGKLAQEKLAAMLPRIRTSSDELERRIADGIYHRDWYESKKTFMLDDLSMRVKFLQENAKGKPHPNGGGFVSDNARVATSAYVGPDAMVLDGAQVKDHACIKEFAVVFGPKTVISGNAKVSGRAWVFGDMEVSGNARILEAATVSTIRREPWGSGALREGRAEINGNAVIKGEHFLLLAYAEDQVLTGGVVMDYTPTIHDSRENGVFKHGRWCRPEWRQYQTPPLSQGMDAGQLYVNWQFNQPKAVTLEDAYVNNNGILHGNPQFMDDGERQCIVFNGGDQYAEAPPSVGDFGELTIDMAIQWEGGSGRLFDFGTGEYECFCLDLAGGSGKPTLIARHHGKTYKVAASEGIPAGKWSRLRVEMDGAEASLYVDGKQVANGTFKFEPRSVFIGDLPEGNFIACGRDKDHFFKGRMDHFRIYRTVHEDFDALGPAPFSLTQKQEWSERTQQLADEWEGRRKAREEELRAGRYGEILDEIKKVEKQKRDADEYRKAEAARVAEREAVEAERKLVREAVEDEQERLAARIQELKEASQVALADGLKSAGLSGRCPYPGKAEAEVKEIQDSVVYHTTADWDWRTPEEARGDIPDKMKKWLEDVRGY